MSACQNIEALEQSFDSYHEASMLLRSERHHKAEGAVLERDGLIAAYESRQDSRSLWNAITAPLVETRMMRRVKALNQEIKANGYEVLYQEVIDAVSQKHLSRKKLTDKGELVALYEHLKAKYGSSFRDDWGNENPKEGHYLFLDFFYVFNKAFSIGSYEYSYLDVEEAILEYKATL